VVLEEKYQTHLIQHTTFEPRVTVAKWSGKRLTLWDSHKNPFRVRNDVARALGVKVNQVRVLTAYIGGISEIKPTRKDATSLQPCSRKRPPDRSRSSTHGKRITSQLIIAIPHVVSQIRRQKDGTLTAIQARLIADLGAYYHFDGAIASLEVAKVSIGAPT